MKKSKVKKRRKLRSLERTGKVVIELKNIKKIKKNDC